MKNKNKYLSSEIIQTIDLLKLVNNKNINKDFEKLCLAGVNTIKKKGKIIFLVTEEVLQTHNILLLSCLVDLD